MIIWGSTRSGRKGGPVADWVKSEAAKDKHFEIDFVDLRELNLPFFDEPTSPFSMQSLDDFIPILKLKPGLSAWQPPRR